MIGVWNMLSVNQFRVKMVNICGLKTLKGIPLPVARSLLSAAIEFLCKHLAANGYDISADAGDLLNIHAVERIAEDDEFAWACETIKEAKKCVDLAVRMQWDVIPTNIDKLLCWKENV